MTTIFLEDFVGKLLNIICVGRVNLCLRFSISAGRHLPRNFPNRMCCCRYLFFNRHHRHSYQNSSGDLLRSTLWHPVGLTSLGCASLSCVNSSSFKDSFGEKIHYSIGLSFISSHRKRQTPFRRSVHLPLWPCFK